MSSPLSPFITSKATIVNLRDLTPTVRQFTLELDHAQTWTPGSHLPVCLDVKGFTTWRHYSLTGATHPRQYQFSVKKLEQGRGGSLALWELHLGDEMLVGQPKNHFPLDATAPAYLLIAGGIGVTPFVSMVQAIKSQSRLQNTPKPLVKMLYGVRSEQELAYVDVFNEHLTADEIHLSLDSLGQRLDFKAHISQMPPLTQAYVCGPQAMLSAVKQAWQACNRPPENLHFETFGTSGAKANEAFDLKVPRHDLSIQVAHDESLLEVLERHGVQTLYDCQRGECGLCAMEVLGVEGEIDHRDVFLTPEEKASNKKICVCVSRVCGTITLDSAYRGDELLSY
jgi:ferredoxin-NADP reductase